MSDDVSETDPPLPSSAVSVTVVTRSSAQVTVVSRARASAISQRASSTDHVAGADAAPCSAIGDPSPPVTSGPASTDTVGSSSTTVPTPPPSSAMAARPALVVRSRPSTSRNVSVGSAAVSPTTWAVTSALGLVEVSVSSPRASSTSPPTSAVPARRPHGTVKVSPSGMSVAATVKVTGVVPASPSVTVASPTVTGSGSSSVTVTVPSVRPSVASTGAASRTVSRSSGSTTVSPTTERCTTVEVCPAGMSATPCASA